MGSGTSHGVPVIGCMCPVCLSTNSHDKRLRCSAVLNTGDISILIDTSTDFRHQALKYSVKKLDAILFTHAHADHTHGLDDIRPLCFGKKIPVYCDRVCEKEIREKFSYIFKETQKGGGKPLISLNIIDQKKFKAASLTVTPIKMFHGRNRATGYRFGDTAYITDCSGLPDKSMEKLQGIKNLVIDGLRYRPHETHFTIDQAIEIAEKTGAAHTWITHICHDMSHTALETELPGNISPAFDGLEIDVGDL
ncbi:MAG: MBL fold metallo-hydrolase [Fibrobacterota bacterium]